MKKKIACMVLLPHLFLKDVVLSPIIHNECNGFFAPHHSLLTFSKVPGSPPGDALSKDGCDCAKMCMA